MFRKTCPPISLKRIRYGLYSSRIKGRWEEMDHVAESAGKQDAETRAYCYQVSQRYVEDKDLFFQIWHAVETFRSKHRLGEISHPTLIVFPAKFAQAAHQARRMERLIPDARRVIIPEAGQMVMMDNPE